MTVNAGNPNETVSIHQVFKSKSLASVQKDLLASNRQQAIEIIQSRIPTNISRVQELLKASESDRGHSLHPCQVEKDSYLKAVLDREGNGQGPEGEGTGRRFLDRLCANENQIKVIQIMDRECQDLYFIAQELKMWLELEVPVIEDGNSFGTEVQEHVMNELSEACKQANTMRNGARQHHIDRQKMASLWAAHPNIEDYAYSIAGSDRLDHFLARCHLRNILRIYTSLLHKMAINWSKVVEPKGQSHTGGMY